MNYHSKERAARRRRARIENAIGFAIAAVLVIAALIAMDGLLYLLEAIQNGTRWPVR